MEPRLRQTRGRRSPHRARNGVGSVVLVGLAISVIVGVFLIEAPAEPLPGVALGSGTILVVERIAALFGIGLLVLVVVVRALRGELPVEVSGRGVRYADAEISQVGLSDSERALSDLDREVRTLAQAVVDLGEQQDTSRTRR